VTNSPASGGLERQVCGVSSCRVAGLGDQCQLGRPRRTRLEARGWLWEITEGARRAQAAVRTTRPALPHMLDRGTGSIVSCSVNATLPDPLVIDYSAANAALANFSKALSKEVGPEASASTRSGLDRSPPTSGSATTASPAPSPERVAATQTPRPGKWPVAPYLDDSPDQRSR
jgi:hypothetical protein